MRTQGVSQKTKRSNPVVKDIYISLGVILRKEILVCPSQKILHWNLPIDKISPAKQVLAILMSLRFNI